LALVSALPESFQEAVRAGEITSWAANRVLLPLARANEADAGALLAAIRQEPLSTRALSTWFAHYQPANGVQRERMLELHISAHRDHSFRFIVTACFGRT
jgi:hypothetical protein